MPVQAFYTKVVKYKYVIMNAEIFINGLVCGTLFSIAAAQGI